MNLRIITLFTLLIIAGIGLTSCNRVLLIAYGMKGEPKKLTEKQISERAKKWDIPTSQLYELDTKLLIDHFKKFDSLKLNQDSRINNYMQPLQICYYNKEGKLISWFVNCNAGGFPNLNWNQSGSFNNAFPPSPTLTSIDSLLNLQQHIGITRPTQFAENHNNSISEYTVVIYWNLFMGRQSKRMIQLVQKNMLMYDAAKLRVLYVNNDNALSDLLNP